MGIQWYPLHTHVSGGVPGIPCYLASYPTCQQGPRLWRVRREDGGGRGISPTTPCGSAGWQQGVSGRGQLKPLPRARPARTWRGGDAAGGSDAALSDVKVNHRGRPAIAHCGSGSGGRSTSSDGRAGQPDRGW